jgi:uncharacterized membrane protein YozB (DUF420 family)
MRVGATEASLFKKLIVFVRAMVPSKSSSPASGALTVSEWTAIVSSLAFLVLWLGISFN